MIPRIAGGWQTTMADLALILFIVSVAGLQGGKEAKAKPGFAFIVLVPSLPFIGVGVYLLRRAERLKEDDED